MTSPHNIKLSALADQYTAGRMTDTERESFELRMLDEPEVAQAVALSERMRAGVRQLQESGELQSLLRRQARHVPAWSRWSLAATLLVVAAGAAFYLLRTPPVAAPLFAAQLEALRLAPGVVVTGPFVLADTRQADDAVVISVPREAKAVRIDALPPEGTGVASYRVTLLRQDAISTFQTDTLDSGLVTAYLDTSGLSPGPYRIAVETLQADGVRSARAEYPVRFEWRD